jgi:hypothetical protein
MSDWLELVAVCGLITLSFCIAVAVVAVVFLVAYLLGPLALVLAIPAGIFVALLGVAACLSLAYEITG